MRLHPIRNEKEYDEALERIDALMEISPAKETAESDELEVLVMLVEKYEEKFWKIEEPDPIEAIKVRMAQRDLERKDLEAFIGSKGKVADVLNGKTGLSLAMIAKLSIGLDLPTDLLIHASSWYRKHTKKTHLV